MPLALKEVMGATTSEVSWVVSIYFFGVVIMRPISGLIADRFGKRKMAFLFFGFFALVTIGYMALPGLAMLLAIRFAHGVFHSISTTAHAALAVDNSPAAMKGQGIGYYGLAMCLAMVIAPALGLYILDNYNYQTLLVVATLMAFLGAVITFFIDKQPKNIVEAKPSFSFKNLIELNAVPIGIASFLIALCYSGIIAFIAVYLKDIGIVNGAIYFYLAFALSMVATRPFVGKILDKKGSSYLIYPSLTLFSLGMLAMGLASGLPSVLFAGVILGLSYGAIFPSFQTIAVKSCLPQKSGAAMGTFFMFYDLGFAAGAFVLAKIVSIGGYSTMYLAISLLTLIVVLYFFLIKRFMLIKELGAVS